jgi:hypothetical protein
MGVGELMASVVSGIDTALEIEFVAGAAFAGGAACGEAAVAVFRGVNA